MLFNGGKVKALEEDLAKCRSEVRELREVLNFLEEGVVILGKAGIEFINDSAREILKEVPLEEVSSSDAVRVIARTERFMILAKENKPEVEAKEEKKEEKIKECLKNMRDQLQPIIEDINQLSSQAMASFTELDEVFRIVSNGLEVVKEMSQISTQTEKSIEKDLELVKELSRESENIVRILSLINEISEQTNMLALNAAIEAARAGELGRGFAVVAEEVRRLAGKTMEFTENIDSLLKEIDERIERTKKHMEDVVRQASSQRDQASDVEELFHLVEYRMEGLKGKYEEVSSRLESIMSVMQDTIRSIESMV